MIAQTFQLEQCGPLVVATIEASKLSGLQAEDLVAELSNRIRYDGASHFILDMAAVQYIDSTCLGALVTFLRELEHVRGRMGLVNCQQNVAFLFKVTRLDTVFSIYEEMGKAKAEIMSQPAR
jgi:anti-sigma B factor antagonist